MMLSHLTNFSQDLGPLFPEVQLNGIFADSITFNDCVPKYPYEEILERYHAEKEIPTFDLTVFVFENFDLPDFEPAKYETDPSKPITEHIHGLWDILTREHYQETGSSLIPLPHPYVVPGGRFRGMYYWDSYFTMLGLQVSGRTDLIQHMIDNFAFCINELGFIPNANRTYYLTRSQPPFLALMIQLLESERGDAVWEQYLPALEKEYAFWMTGAETVSTENPASARVVQLPDGTLFNRYWDASDEPRPESFREDVEVAVASRRNPQEVYRHIRAATESGWDFSSRWLRDQHSMESIHTADLIPVDLNCLLLHIEQTLVAQYRRLTPSSDQIPLLEQRAAQRRKGIQRYCWNRASGFYFDYDWIQQAPTDVFSLAAVYPLFVNVATHKQARTMVTRLEKEFLQPGGYLTTLHTSRQQWDAPNGWAPLQWLTYIGLCNYGFHELAQKGKERWLNTNRKVYELTGKLTEKYNVMNKLSEAKGGEYPNQDGFGWTNGVYLKMDASKELSDPVPKIIFQ